MHSLGTTFDNSKYILSFSALAFSSLANGLLFQRVKGAVFFSDVDVIRKGGDGGIGIGCLVWRN